MDDCDTDDDDLSKQATRDSSILPPLREAPNQETTDRQQASEREGKPDPELVLPERTIRFQEDTVREDSRKDREREEMRKANNDDD